MISIKEYKVLITKKMADILPFRNPEEKGENCIYYVPKEDREVLMIDGPPSQYCRHPDRLKGYYLSEDIIREFKLYRLPGDWCPKYERVSYDNETT